MDGLGYACALLLAGAFVRAGGAKLARPSATAAGFAALGLPAAARVARAVPFVELAVAVALVAAPRVGGGASLVVLAAFSVVLVRALRSGVTVPCNCFGTSRADPVSPTDLVRNALLGGLAVAALAAPGPRVPSLAAALISILAFCAGVAALGARRRQTE